MIIVIFVDLRNSRDLMHAAEENVVSRRLFDMIGSRVLLSRKNNVGVYKLK